MSREYGRRRENTMDVIRGKGRKKRIRSIPVNEVKIHHCRCDGNGSVLLHEGRSAGLLIECAEQD